MKTYQHVNIVQTYDSFLENDEVLWIVMENVGTTTLKNLIAGMTDGMSDELIAAISKQILAALFHLHSHGLIYRNVRTDKIFLASNGRVKLSDFSSCIQVSETQIPLTIIKSEIWKYPPELIENLVYGPEFDIWSFGIVVKLMIDKEIAFFDVPSAPDAKVHLKKSVPSLLEDFLNHMIVCDPARRSTAAELLEHQFIRRAKGHEFIVQFLPKDRSI